MEPRRPKRRYHLQRGGVVYLLMTALMGLAAFNSQANLLFWAFGVMVGGAVASAVIGTLMMRGIRVRRLSSDHGAKGEPMPLRYELTNRNHLLPCFGLSIEERDGIAGWSRGDEGGGRGPALRHEWTGWVLHVGPRSTIQAQAMAWPTERGRKTLDRIRISSAFPFGVLSRSVTFSQPGEVVVYPEIWRIRRDRLRASCAVGPTGARSADKSGGHEEFFGLREYRDGDSLKLIDWKHTARLARLVSRELTQPSPPRMMILLDLAGYEAARQDGPDAPDSSDGSDGSDSPDGPDPAEEAINLAASLLCEAQFAGFEVGLTVLGAACPSFDVRPGRWHRDRMLRALGELEVGSAELADQHGPFPRDVRWMVVHTGPVDRSRGPAGAEHVSVAEREAWKAAPAPKRADEEAQRNVRRKRGRNRGGGGSDRNRERSQPMASGRGQEAS